MIKWYTDLFFFLKRGQYLLCLSFYLLHGILCTSRPSEATNQVVYQMLWKVTYEIIILARHQLKQVAYSQDKEVFKISVW